MADSATAEGSSLSEAFGKVNHWRHILMDLSMIGMAIGALVATGGASGFFDPVLAWLKMHVSGIPALFTSGPQFLTGAFAQAQQGVLFTGAQAAHAGMHGMAGMGSMHGAAATGAAGMHGASSMAMPAPTPTPWQSAAADMYGMEAQELSELMNNHD